MKGISVLLICSIFLSFEWKKDFESAKEIAQKENKHILLNFSGSDWSGPCKKLKKTHFNDTAFLNFAERNLILVNIDFPKNMKDISSEQNAKNEAIADQFNKEGEFPMTLLLDKTGKVIEKWVGPIQGKTLDFVDLLKSSISKD